MTERNDNRPASTSTSTSAPHPTSTSPGTAAAGPAAPRGGGKPDEDFAALFAASERTGRRGRPVRYAIGDRVSGKLITIGRDVAVIDLDGGGEGTLDVVELRDESGQLTVQVGETVEARVVAKGEKDGVVTLRRAPRAAMRRAPTWGSLPPAGCRSRGRSPG